MRKIIKFLSALLLLLCVLPIGYYVLDSKEPSSYEANKPYNSDQVGIYIINLERSKERFEYVKNSVEALGYSMERINAIDGKTIPQELINLMVDLKAYDEYLGHYPKLGTIGCSFSHIKAWENFLSSDFEFAIIFEDDVSFEPIALKKVIEQLKKNTKLWDIVNFEISHSGTPLTIKTFEDGQRLVVYLTEITHAGAYMINRIAAQKLIEKAFPIKMPIDHYFTRAWEFNIKFAGMENPRLVHQSFGPSDIAQTISIPKREVDIFTQTKRGIYKFQSYIIRFFYNLKIYCQSI